MILNMPRQVNDNISENSIILAVRQALIVGYMLGILWIRRYPTSMTFSAAQPFSLLFVVFVIGGGQNLPFAIAGGLVVALVGFGLSLGADHAYYKIEFKLQDLFIASPVSSFTYLTGLAFSLLLFGLPSLVVLSILVMLLSTSVLNILLLLATILLLWGLMSLIGFSVSSRMPHTRNVEQLTTFIQIVVAVLPPVFYSIDILPFEELRYVAYAVPTTHASLILQHVMGVQTPADWSIWTGLAVLTGYFVAFSLLARAKAVWRET
jgi:ABC-2 type transport system permease protein